MCELKKREASQQGFCFNICEKPLPKSASGHFVEKFYSQLTNGVKSLIPLCKFTHIGTHKTLILLTFSVVTLPLDIFAKQGRLQAVLTAKAVRRCGCCLVFSRPTQADLTRIRCSHADAVPRKPHVPSSLWLLS